MKHIFRSTLLLTLVSTSAFAALHQYTVYPKDIHGGFVAEQIPMKTYGIPTVILKNAVYTSVTALPKGATPDDASHFKIHPGMELKQPFAAISIPAYKLVDGKYQVLASFTLDVAEPEAPRKSSLLSTAKITATATPLASGTWYKIAVVDRGIYKMDLAFLQSLGVNTATINPGNIWLVGNGGALLSEDNKVARPLDLTENAIWVNDGGDGAFNTSDFIAFYAPGNMRWDKDSTHQRFIHAKNIYADTSFYFISFDAGAGLRIANAPAAANATTTVTSFNDYTAHEIDLYNPGKFGKEWWGEKFGISSNALPEREFAFPLNGNIDSVNLRISVASRAVSTGDRMSVALNGAPVTTYSFAPVALEDDNQPVDAKYSDLLLPVKNSTATIKLTYTAASEAIGYLNFLELNWRRPLSFPSDNFSFRDWRSVAPGAIATYIVSGATSASQVWDVTDPLHPVKMSGGLNGSAFSFNQTASYLHEFVALNGTSFSTPFAKGKVDNQNLHAADAPKLVIVVHPDFVDAANNLAAYHRDHDGMKVLVATTQQVYNEFSSGGQDISGIRDMMRYFYLAAGNDTSRMPRYLLLFGDASYDYKDRISKNSNYVPTFESADGEDVFNAFTVDDFFGFLDDNEYMDDFSIANTLDIGIGRLPINTPEQANDAVNKIIAYHAPKSLGPWRLSNTYLGDNEDDAGEHEHDAEDICSAVDAASPFSNSNKIYLDNLPFISTPSGPRCPEANKIINDQIFKGTFLLNYTGHGSITTLAHERILTKEDFTTWKNLYKMPFMVTATCDYARYDNPEYVSNGEQMILKSDGGTIAMLTTTGPVYAGENRTINQQFIAEQYTQHNGIWPTFGDAIRAGKNISYRDPKFSSEVNFYRFTLLGDPAVQPAFPQHVIRTNSVLELKSGLATDSIRALGNYSVSGHISTTAGIPINDFQGRAYVTIFDKKRVINTAVKAYPKARYSSMQYYVRDNVIFKGITTVKDGHFTFSFIAPKDMAYDFGDCRISYYAENGITDAAGMDTTITAGGFQDGANADNDAPLVKPFIGDSLFRDGGVTGSNTLLYVQLSDESGINVSGNGVGHDLTAVLDNDEESPYVLNDYYITEPNTYKQGHVSFPVSGLADGPHTFTVKAWDVYNNSGSGTVHFIVGNGKIMKVDNLVNYPNPFSDRTHFFFEHNHPSEVLNVQIAVYDMAGRQVRQLETSFTPGGSHSNEIIWDGRADNGALLNSGVYPYRIMLSTVNGVQGTAYQKLVIVR